MCEHISRAGRDIDQVLETPRIRRGSGEGVRLHAPTSFNLVTLNPVRGWILYLNVGFRSDQIWDPWYE